MGYTSGNGRVSGEGLRVSLEGLCPIHITLCFLIVAQMYSLRQERLPRLPTMMDCTLELDPEFHHSHRKRTLEGRSPIWGTKTNLGSLNKP